MDYNISGFGIHNEFVPKFLLLIKPTWTVRTIHIVCSLLKGCSFYPPVSAQGNIFRNIIILMWKKKSSNWPDHWFWLPVDATSCLLHSDDLETAAPQNLSHGSSSAQEYHQRVLIQHEQAIKFSYKMSLLGISAVSDCPDWMVLASHIQAYTTEITRIIACIFY